MVVVGCSHGVHIAPKIARKLKLPYMALKTTKFPDGESHILYPKPIRGRKVVLVQSFHGRVNDSLVEVLFAAYTARDLGAKQVTLVAPYAPYFRQDVRFHPGEVVSQKIMGKLFNRALDGIAVVDPHLHRTHRMSDLFSILKRKITANSEIAKYIAKHYNKPVIVGPDWESFQWAEAIAKHAGSEVMILKKKRLSGRKVKVHVPAAKNLKGKEVVLVDDIVSTGHTVIEAKKQLSKLGVKKFHCVAVHGVFADNALAKLKKHKIDIVCTNTIPTAVSKIDVSSVIASTLKNRPS